MASATPAASRRVQRIIALPVLSLPPNPEAALLPYPPRRVALHAAFLRPRTPLERTAILAGFASRRLRYRLWDAVWEPFEAVVGGAVARGAADPVTAWTWRIVNRATTRKGGAAEWTLRGIADGTEEIAVLYPTLEGEGVAASVPPLSEQIPSTLLSQHMLPLLSPALANRIRTRMALAVLLAPASVLLAKVLLPAAQALLAYNLFTAAQCWRALSGRAKLEALWRAGRVRVEGSPEAGEAIRLGLLDRWAVEKDAGAEQPTFSWGDLDKETVADLEKSMKLYELGRSYERYRRELLVRPESQPASTSSGE